MKIRQRLSAIAHAPFTIGLGVGAFCEIPTLGTEYATKGATSLADFQIWEQPALTISIILTGCGLAAIGTSLFSRQMDVRQLGAAYCLVGAIGCYADHAAFVTAQHNLTAPQAPVATQQYPRAQQPHVPKCKSAVPTPTVN